MNDRLEDTRPRPAYSGGDTSGDIPAPPKLLLWSVIGVFVLGIVGVIAALVIFRSVLQPAQQQRVIDQLPFMEAFLPYRDPAARLPTPEANSTPGGIAPGDLLNLSINDATSTPEATTTETQAALLVTAVVTETVLPTLTPTMTAMATVTEAVIPSATPAPTLEAVQATAEVPAAVASPVTNTLSFEPNALLTGITYRKQGWNECGPANVTMALSYFGWQNDLAYAAQRLKWGREDKNVNPSEIVAFVNSETQVRALTRIGGDVTLVKALVSAGFPVILETSYMFEGYDWIGHYRTIVGYDTNTGVFTINDSFLGEGIQETFASVDEYWQHFNRRFIVIYRPQDEATVASILGDLADPIKAAENAFKVAQAEVKQDSTDAFAWFNMGSSLVMMGDYDRAAVAYTEALKLDKLPFRMMWYQFGAFEAWYEVGRYKDVLSYVSTNLESTGGYVEEIYYWQGKALAATNDTAGALTAFRTALRMRPSYEEARVALEALENA